MIAALCYFAMFVLCVLAIVVAERCLWRTYWERRGFEWSEERGRLERIRQGMGERRE